jgi:hypothetical protein
MDHTFDVVVAGCGVAGLSAADAGSLPNTERRNPRNLSDGLKQGLDVFSR